MWGWMAGVRTVSSRDWSRRGSRSGFETHFSTLLKFDFPDSTE